MGWSGADTTEGSSTENEQPAVTQPPSSTGTMRQSRADTVEDTSTENEGNLSQHHDSEYAWAGGATSHPVRIMEIIRFLNRMESAVMDSDRILHQAIESSAFQELVFEYWSHKLWDIAEN